MRYQVDRTLVCVDFHALFRRERYLRFGDGDHVGFAAWIHVRDRQGERERLRETLRDAVGARQRRGAAGVAHLGVRATHALELFDELLRVGTVAQADRHRDAERLEIRLLARAALAEFEEDLERLTALVLVERDVERTAADVRLNRATAHHRRTFAVGHVLLAHADLVVLRAQVLDFTDELLDRLGAGDVRRAQLRVLVLELFHARDQPRERRLDRIFVHHRTSRSAFALARSAAISGSAVVPAAGAAATAGAAGADAGATSRLPPAKSLSFENVTTCSVREPSR